MSETDPRRKRRIKLPSWEDWLKDHLNHGASDPEEYDLHLAAIEWSLSSPLDINRREDFRSLPGLGVQPFDHQVKDAIMFFRRLTPRGLIADDVGLGKTITAGLIATELRDRGILESILVVCPKSIMGQWQEELATKFGIKARAAVGQDFKELEDHPFWITSYATARNRMELIRKRKFDLLILDEAHALRNLFGTQNPPKVAMVFRALMQEDVARFVLMLTATPIQNRLWDIYSLFEVLRAPQPNPLGSKNAFERRFIADNDARRLRPGTEQEFRRLLGESTIRTRRADTKLIFPTREVKDSRLDPYPEEALFIQKALPVILRFPVLAQYIYARRLMSSPWALAASFEAQAKKLGEETSQGKELLILASEGRKVQRSAKIEAVLKLVKATAKEGRSGRIIVFTSWIETLNHLAAALEQEGFGDQVGIVRGGQDWSNRQAIANYTAEPPSRPILLSTDTGAVGLNLQAGNIVVNYDLPWNPMVVEQRIGRVQRLGKKAARVIVHNLVLRGTIEDHVVLRLMEKLSLFHQAIGEMEELLELCGFGEEQRPLEQVILELVRKAAEQKDIDLDLERMEESRRAAEARMEEMRAVNEEVLASIRPRESEARLEGLEKVTPRMSLRDLVKACVSKAGREIEETEDGRLFLRTGGKVIQLDIEGRGPPEAAGNLERFSERRLVHPGTRAFEEITSHVREEVMHSVLDGTNATLQAIQTRLRERLEPLGLVVSEVSVKKTEPAAAVQVTLKVKAQAMDRYETLIEIGHSNPEDQVDGLLLGTPLDPSGHPLERVRGAQLRRLEPLLSTLELKIQEGIDRNESMRRFCEFYEKRFEEDVVRLASQIGGSDAGQPEEFVKQVARVNRAVAAAYESLQNRFLAALSVELVGMAGLQYERAELVVLLRNRKQKEAHPFSFHGVP